MTMQDYYDVMYSTFSIAMYQIATWCDFPTIFSPFARTPPKKPHLYTPMPFLNFTFHRMLS